MPRLRRRAAPVAVLAALAFGIAGCGGAATTQRATTYVEQVNRAQDRFAQTVKDLSGRVTETSTAGQDRRTLHSFTTAVDEVVARLRKIDPPASVASLHRQLVDDIDAYGSAVDAAAAALRSHDAARLRAARRRLDRATTTVGTRIDQTISAINERLKES